VRSRTLHIHERFLRHVWSNQYLCRESMRTADGRSLRVLQAGHLNSEGGPDFRDALLRIGETLYHGDVEIHRTLAEWCQHQHQNDPRYNKVVLHVVLERPTGPSATIVQSGRSVPLLILGQFLSESLHTLWHQTILDDRLYSRSTIPCANQNHVVSPELLTRWIQHLAAERLELKLRRFDERLRELAQLRRFAVSEQPPHAFRWRVQGTMDELPPPMRDLTQRDLAHRDHWDQLLYEGLMEGLGYSKNREPFLRLARNVLLSEFRIHHIEEDELSIQALLLGAGGLLPKLNSVHGADSREFVRLLIHRWRILKKLYCSAVMHPSRWQLFPTRPSNFPTLRIGAASGLIISILCNDLFRRIIECLKNSPNGRVAFRVLRGLLTVQPLPFWKNHYQFDCCSKGPTRVLGPDRINELVTNTVVPLSLLYARVFKNRAVRERTLQLFNAIPAVAHNSVTRVMERQLLRGTIPLKSVSNQQGVIQLHNHYCIEGRCIDCAVGAAIDQTERTGVTPHRRSV